MSQFDFPRINFFGEAFINPPTANNNSFFPLVLFDPVNVKAVMPPRIYLSEKLVRIHSLGLLALPEDAPVQTGEDQAPYFEISTINNRQVFKQWATTRLGESPFDTSFHPLYNLIRTVRDNLPLAGQIPCHWNYFGGMDFGFDNVKIISIEVPEKEDGSILYTDSRDDCPPDIEQLIGTPVEMKDERGKNTAVIVNVITTMPYYAQIFCDLFTVGKNGENFLNGKPGKASVRFLNKARIVDQEGPIAGSGTFYCTIPVSGLAEGTVAPVMQFFEKYQVPGGKITGVFIRYDLFEVKENQQPDYNILGTLSNPARCSVLGSITPWYENDMKSITMGRQMIPDQPYFQDKILPPFVFRVNNQRNTINLDLIGSIPETCTDGIYQTYGLGEMIVKCRMDDHDETEIGSFIINQETWSRDKMIETGGLINISYSKNTLLQKKHIENGLFLIYAMKKHKQDEEAEVLLMQEIEYMIASDQPGIYMNQYDDPGNGYICNHQKEACSITIFHKGRPFDGIIPLKIQELRIRTLCALPLISTVLATKEFTNNQKLQFPAYEPAHLIYVLYPGNLEASENFHAYILKTGFIISLRVLPKHDYDRYLDPEHPCYSAQIPFDLIYNEILEVYDLIYPSSSIITPFNEEYFKKGWKFIKQRLSPANWLSSSYMPSSRDMSYDQWQLLNKWGEKIDTLGDQPTKKGNRSLPKIE